MATLALKNVDKKYNDTTIISDLNLNIEAGEFIVVVGPSGCGKSTLLRMIAGLESVTTGTIEINNKVVNTLEPKDRNIAMVFQNYALYPHMTVFENMAYGLRMRKLKKDEIKVRVERVAAALSLQDLLDRKPRALSGGQRQRVAMGRAIVRKPAIFLFDEPLSNLDAKLRVQMRLEIKKLQQQLQTTSLYVTHDQVEAMTLADRIVLLNAGRIEQIGTPLELYTNPASKFVAGFIGSPQMNFLQAKLMNNTTIELTNGSQIKLNHPLMTELEDLVVGIRPEMLKLVDHPVAGMTLKMQAEWIEALGTDTYVYGNLANSEQTLTARLSGKYRFTSGESLCLTIDPQFIYLFDVDSGLRVS